MSTAGHGLSSIEVDTFRTEWQGTARKQKVHAPLPSNWQNTFHTWKARKIRTFELIDLIPIAMRANVNNRWQYYCGIVRNKYGWKPTLKQNRWKP